MCEFIAQAEPPENSVRLEIKAVGGVLSAALTPPVSQPQMISFDEVPLLRAVKMAKLMANVLHTDVAIVDPLGIWHEWLVEWACMPGAVQDGAAAH